MRSQTKNMKIFDPSVGHCVLATVVVAIVPVGDIGEAVDIVAHTSSGREVFLSPSEVVRACRGV